MGHTETSSLPTPYQGLGARGVNNLASKLLLALLPPNTPFFRLLLDSLTIQQLTASGQITKGEIEKSLNKIERAIMEWIETSKARTSVFEALKLLVVTGNALLYAPSKGGVKVYKIDQYCVKRDPMGEVMEIIIQEKIHPFALPESVREHVKQSIKTPDETVEIYTRILRTPKKWEVTQEVEGKEIEESQGSYKLDDCPYNAIRWTAIANEDYGRGLVEEYIGDLISLEGLMQTIVEGSAAAAKILFLVNPNGTTRIKSITESANGDVREGNATDVTVLQANKFADFRVALETVDRIEKRLAYAFLLNTSVQRDAERVTAEEIRYIAKELEDALGGVYSVLSQELQLPFVERMMAQMKVAKKLPAIPKQVKPVITTGLEALGRGQDLNKLDLFVRQLEPLGPETIAEFLRVDEYITRVGTSLGIDTDGLVNTQEDVIHQRQQMMMAQMAQQAGPKVAGEIAKGAVQNAQESGTAAGS